MQENFLDLSNAVYLPNIHDARVTNIRAYDDTLEFLFDREIHRKVGKICFSKFDDIYSDVTIQITDTDTDLNIIGKKYYLDDFLPILSTRNFPIMDILEMFVGYEEVIINGVYLNGTGSSQTRIQIRICAKEMRYQIG